jgi:hypothetical protein
LNARFELSNTKTSWRRGHELGSKRFGEEKEKEKERRRSSQWAAMAALPAKDAATITASNNQKKGVNLQDPYCLKRVLYDATSEVRISILLLYVII